MSQHTTFLAQFRSFCFQNKADDIEKAIEYFAVFGGMGWKVDMSKPLDELIETKVLANYRYIHADIAKITQSNKNHHSLLSALASGDRREHSAFKRASLSRKDGEESAGFLIDTGLLTYISSQEMPADDGEEVSGRLLFVTPFMRFWFAAISPYYKGVRDGNYAEVKEHWGNIKQEFITQTYEGLVMALVQKTFADDTIKNIGSYWDKNVEIEILGQTKSGKIIAGACKYSKSKANRSEITKLQEKCAKAKLAPDICVIYSKGGFSSEFNKEKSADLRLFALKNLKILMETLNEKDILITTNKKY